jgi:hypothetical protein
LVNWDWMMKLKTNKTFTKEPIPKIKNQNNKNWSWNVNNQEGQTTIFEGREGKKKFVVTKSNHQRRHVTPTGRVHGDASNGIVKW